MNTTEKIIELILQHVNGYGKEEAQELAPTDRGSNLYNEIEEVIASIPTWKCFNDELPEEGEYIIVFPCPEQMTMPFPTKYNDEFEWVDGDMWISHP